MNTEENQVLSDVSQRGKVRPWRDKKLKNQKLSDSYKRLGYEKKAFRVRDCGTFLSFAECKNDNYKKLVGANFCKNRLCPMCNWRRSRMLAAQVLQIINESSSREPMRFIFLTLTVRNCQGAELPETMDKLFEGFNRLFKYKKVANVVKGHVRALEVTRNANRYSQSYDTYHPHFHVLISVKPSFFKDKYIKQKEWVRLWQKALKIDYEPSVNVKAVKDKRGDKKSIDAVLETAKYTVKDSEYITNNPTETDKAVKILDNALRYRRLIGYGGLFKTVKKELKLKDIESSETDLVGADEHECSCPVCGGELKQELYKWHFGLNEYFKDLYGTSES